MVQPAAPAGTAARAAVLLESLAAAPEPLASAPGPSPSATTNATEWGAVDGLGAGSPPPSGSPPISIGGGGSGGDGGGTPGWQVRPDSCLHPLVCLQLDVCMPPNCLPARAWQRAGLLAALAGGPEGAPAGAVVPQPPDGPLLLQTGLLTVLVAAAVILAVVAGGFGCSEELCLAPADLGAAAALRALAAVNPGVAAHAVLAAARRLATSTPACCPALPPPNSCRRAAVPAGGSGTNVGPRCMASAAPVEPVFRPVQSSALSHTHELTHQPIHLPPCSVHADHQPPAAAASPVAHRPRAHPGGRDVRLSGGCCARAGPDLSGG